MQIVRRTLLSGIGIGAGLMLAPRIARAAAGAADRRFVFIIQRGAADGLNTVIPCGDPGYAAQRGALAIDAGTAIRLDGMFSLHPSLVETGKLFAAGQALFVHAVASPYRDRSHFDGQNVLESGGTAPYALPDGWLNRVTGLLPQQAVEAVALAPTVPLSLRGPNPVTSYAATSAGGADEDLLMRVGELYAGDPQLHPLWAAAIEARALAGDTTGRQDAASLGRLAAGFLRKPDGPRVAMIETGGWDTHSAQNPRLAAQLRHLDALLAALRDGLSPVWADTVVLVATEFGRTVAVNGTAGTDHGTASVAMILGGAVNGGRVVADWPGLGAGALQDGRDLKPTTDMDSVLATLVAETFMLDPALVARAVAPGRAVQPLRQTLLKA